MQYSSRLSIRSGYLHHFLRKQIRTTKSIEKQSLETFKQHAKRQPSTLTLYGAVMQNDNLQHSLSMDQSCRTTTFYTHSLRSSHAERQPSTLTLYEAVMQNDNLLHSLSMKQSGAIVTFCSRVQKPGHGVCGH